MGTADPKLDGRLDWNGTFAALVAAYPNGPGALFCLAPTTDQGLCYWNSRASAWLSIIEAGGDYGSVGTVLYRWRPTGNRAVTFASAPTAGGSNPLSGSWGGASGLYPCTLSTGQVVTAQLTNGSTACNLLQYPAPATGSYANATITGTPTTAATASGQPPVVGVSNFYSTSASIAASGAAVLAATAPDVPRNVIGAWTGTATATVTGTDYYGKTQTEVSASGTSLATKKTFASITSIVMSASVTAATFGTGNVLGLPFRVSSGDIDGAMFNDGADAGTFVAPDLTMPATSSTGDVRGTYVAAGTLNGAKFLAIIVKVADPLTQIGTIGVTPA